MAQVKLDAEGMIVQVSETQHGSVELTLGDKTPIRMSPHEALRLSHMLVDAAAKASNY
jgi:hypothetical protein